MLVFSDDVDHAADRVVAVEHRAAVAAGYLDALDRVARMVDRSTRAMSTSLSRRPLMRIRVLAVAKAPKPRKSTEVLAPVTRRRELVTCTPGTRARMSGSLLAASARSLRR